MSPLARSQRLSRAVGNSMRLALVAVLCAVSASIVPAQRASRAPRREGSLRVEATGWVNLGKSPLDPSGGREKYWFHLSAAKARGRTSGGLTLDLPKRIVATATDMQPSTPAPGVTATGQATTEPLRAKVIASGDYEGRKLTFEVDLVSNKWTPASAPGARGRSTPGSITIKLTAVERKAGGRSVVQVIPVSERPYVRFHDNRPSPGAGGGGGFGHP